jgi:hypothetical protein
MQLPRVIIAAIFLIIGAIIAVPPLWKAGTSNAASTSATSSPSISVSGTPHPTATKTTPSPIRSTPKPTRSTPRPTATKPTLTVSVSPVGCPSREVRVTVADSGAAAADYTIEQNGSVVLADRVSAGNSRTNPVTLEEDKTTTLTVLSGGKTVRSVTRTAHCSASAAPTTSKSLPHTGPDSASLYAKIATGIAAMITGVIVFWWGGMWPRRRESMYGDPGASKELRKPSERIGR